MKRKQLTETINTALRSGDTTRPIIGRDAYAPKAGKGDKTAKTLTQLVKEAQEARDKAKELYVAVNAMAGVVENRFAQSKEKALTAQRYAAKAIIAAVASVIALVATLIVRNTIL